MAYAADPNPSSPHYQVVQGEFGATSTDKTCSGNYCSQAGIGNTAGGPSSSTTMKAITGPVTDSQPELNVSVTAGASDLGTFSSTQTSTTTMGISVKSYLSDGYTLQIIGNPPTYGGHTIKALSSPTASTIGSEQFGINVVKNTTPNIGTDPLQVPSSQTSFGEVADNYKTPNKFMYSSGDVVALSHSASGQTNYTVSMIVNISNATPAGQYAADFGVIVTPGY